MNTAIETTAADGEAYESDGVWAVRILEECRDGMRDSQSLDVLSAVAILGVTAAVEIFTGEPFNSPQNAAKVSQLPLGRRLVRELNRAQRH